MLIFGGLFAAALGEKYSNHALVRLTLNETSALDVEQFIHSNCETLQLMDDEEQLLEDVKLQYIEI